MIGFRPGHRVISVVTALLVLACAPPARLQPEPVSAGGTWEGEARTGDARLSLTVTLEEGHSGWRGTVNVPSQYALDYPLVNVRLAVSAITFAFPDVLPPAAFTGVLERGRIRGQFTSPLGSDTLRGTFELWRRPGGTVPYAAEEARFPNGDLPLAGTVFRPRTAGAHPAIVFVHGSGPQTRDSYLRWFADRFARAGFVTLIYDRRGTGESGGERWPQTSGSFADLADDAIAAAHFLRGQADVDAERIGVWGLSQGAWIAPLAAVRAPDVFGFLILLSGGGVSPAEQELYDDEVKLRGLGFDDNAIAEALSYLRRADQYVRTQSDEDWNRFARARDEVRSRSWYPHLDRFPQGLPREAPVWRGLRTDLDYDPIPVLRTLRVPVLLILGEEDRLTPPRETAGRVRRALEAGSNRNLTLQLLPSADHALKVKPTPQSPWLAETPAGHWVSEMIEWVRMLP